MPFFRNGCSHQLKADRSPVTEADVAANDFLISALTKLHPKLKVVSEEAIEGANPTAPAEEHWLIDPLDGTRGFLQGKPEFTVNIALMRNGRPIAGVVHAPAIALTYLARIGEGAWRLEGEGAKIPIQTRPAERHRLTVVASKDHSGPRVRAMLERMDSPALTSIGSSLKFCLVAEGRADLYLRDLPTMEWDTAAAQCIVEAAGGRVLELSGKPLGYGKPGLKNPAIITIGDPEFGWQELVPSDPQ